MEKRGGIFPGGYQNSGETGKGPPVHHLFLDFGQVFGNRHHHFHQQIPPRLSEPRNGMPCPFRRKVVWLWVPAGIVRRAVPVRVGTVISPPPRSAVLSPMAVLLWRSVPCRSNEGFLVTCTTAYRSPPGALLHAGFPPSPAMRRNWPSLTPPRGMDTSMRRVFCIVPLPPWQVSQTFPMIFPPVRRNPDTGGRWSSPAARRSAAPGAAHRFPGRWDSPA